MINLGEDFYTVSVIGTVKMECYFVGTGSCSFFELQSAVLKASQGKILYRLKKTIIQSGILIVLAEKVLTTKSRVKANQGLSPLPQYSVQR